MLRQETSGGQKFHTKFVSKSPILGWFAVGSFAVLNAAGE